MRLTSSRGYIEEGHAQMMCRLCGCYITNYPTDSSGVDECPDCTEAKADDMMIEEILNDVDDSSV